MNAGRVLMATALILTFPALADHQPRLLGTLTAIAPTACAPWVEAEQAALESAGSSARAFCRSRGFGWRSWSIQDTGKLECLPCGGNDALQCSFRTVAVKCEKPQTLSHWLIRP